MDAAAREDWTNAVMSVHARSTTADRRVLADNQFHRCGVQPAEQMEVRLATLAVVEAVRELCSRRRLLRYQGRTLALLDKGPVIPLEQVPRFVRSPFAT